MLLMGFTVVALFLIYELHSEKPPKLITIPLQKESVDLEDSEGNETLKSATRINLKNFGEARFFANMTFGTPPQRILVIIDTGSTDTWVFSHAMCSQYTDLCINHTTYDHNKSSSYSEIGRKFKITYGDGSSVKGTTSEDIVTIGSATVYGQVFGECLVAHQLFRTYRTSGLLGLSRVKSSHLGEENNSLLGNLIEQGLIDKDVFALYLKNIIDDPKNPAQLVLGGIDSHHFTGTLTYTPIVEGKSGFWMIKIDGFSIGSKQITNSYLAHVDCGTGVNLFPLDYIDEIHKLLNAQTCQGNFCFVDCKSIDNMPDLKFTIEKTLFTFNPKEYVAHFNTPGGEKCIILIGSIRKDNMVLGIPFMMKYYTVFEIRNKRIGFALATSNSGILGVPKIGKIISPISISLIFVIIAVHYYL